MPYSVVVKSRHFLARSTSAATATAAPNAAAAFATTAIHPVNEPKSILEEEKTWARVTPPSPA